ncbi:MAG: MJ0042-type zinc finger domain-containing protein [Thermoplasmatota archaeon]
MPEAHGAPSQRCPHCQTVFVPGAASAPPTVASAALPEWPKGIRALDATGALSLGLRLFWRDWPRSLVLWTPVLAVSLAANLGGVAWARANALPANISTADPGLLFRFLGFAIPVFLLSAIVNLAWWAPQASLVRARLAGATPTLAGALQTLAARLSTVGALAAVLTLLYVAGAIALVVPALVFLYWYLFAPAAALEADATLPKALAASRAFAREKKTLGFTLVVLVAVALAYLVTRLLTAGAGALAEATRPGSYDWGTAAGDSIGTWLFAPLAPTLAAAFYFGVKLGVPPVRAVPAPEATFPTAAAPGAGAIELTKCPHCATVFPYKPSAVAGDAVRVECPTCGKAGLIR